MSLEDNRCDRCGGEITKACFYHFETGDVVCPRCLVDKFIERSGLSDDGCPAIYGEVAEPTGKGDGAYDKERGP